MRKNICVLISMLFFMTFGYAQNGESYFEQLSSKPDFKEVKSFADSVYELGKTAIPLLINDFARKEKVFIGLGKRHLSTFPLVYWRDNYRGIRSVYFIEYILKRDSIYKQNKESLNNMPEGEAKDMVLESYLYYLWNSNVIAKNVNDEPLTYENMQKVKKIYERWWRVNRHKSVDELRKEFCRKSILEGSPYHWL